MNTTWSQGWRCVLAAAAIAVAPWGAMAADNPFVGRWALTIPGGAAGWLGIDDVGGRLSGSLLWGGGSVEPVTSVRIENNTLVVTRVHQSERPGPGGKPQPVRETENIRATVDGDKLSLTTERVQFNGSITGKTPFTGVRIAPLPPAPDLAKVQFGEPVELFNGKDLTGWRLTSPGAVNGWSVQNGVLLCRPVQEQGKPHKNYGNLRTDREFEDFNLKLEVRLSPKSNSGVYLRGIYEVQVLDCAGAAPESHIMGALYSRIAPSENAAKGPGEWQTMDLTLVERHLTVVLNGKKVIDNQPILGCTGGALWSDETRPGPIYLQGDHSNADYRNLVLRPVKK